MLHPEPPWLFLYASLDGMRHLRTGSLCVPSNEPKHYGAHLSWVVDKPDRTFSVYVVEPYKYDPPNHSAIFVATLNALIALQGGGFDAYDDEALKQRKPAAPFDLVTFPEAFLPSADLLTALKSVENWPRFGCVHLGLRPDTDAKRHLFTLTELRDLVDKLRVDVPRISKSDIAEFGAWLDEQDDHDSRFNIGCVFTIDTSKDVRICLHPKGVRSKFERSALKENNMTEANFLSLVTLRPTNKNLKTVTLQPLLCSDALELSKDNGEPGPLNAVNRPADALGASPPDHIDVVSVATCTPQTQVIPVKGEPYFEWHDQFRNSFVRATSSALFPRHHFSTFVLSNFGFTDEAKTAGLSGTFMPIALRKDEPPEFITWSCWGIAKGEKRMRWSSPREGYAKLLDWDGRAFLAYVEPIARHPGAAGRMFGFTFDRFPRDVTPGIEKTGLLRCSYWIAEPATEAPFCTFKEVQDV